MNLPNHIAIIMDGNGRWAQKRNHNRFFGHIRGAKVAYDIIEGCAKLSLKYLTLFAFSTENWKRPKDEVSLLMSLLIKHLKKEQKKLMAHNIRFHTIGDPSALPLQVQETLLESIELTRNNTGMNLTFALNYGGRQEILESIKKIARDVSNGKVNLEDINENLLNSSLQSAYLPDPDLIIRTSNEKRISNFFLWQSAYSELYFSEKLWPEFNMVEFHEAVNDYNSRERRYGKIPNAPSRTSPEART